MPLDLEEFHQDFLQDVYGTADAEGHYAEDAFFDLFCNQLVEAGELDTADRVQYLSPRGLRIDGYGGDPAASGGTLSLIIADFSQSTKIESLTASAMDAIFKRASNFLTKALSPSFRDRLEETSPAFGLADLIAKRWTGVSKVRLFLISTRLLSARIDGREVGELNGVPLTYSVWDIGRLHRFATAGHGREDIEIDLENAFGGPWPALPAHLHDAGYESYLIVIPGAQLAAIYDRWTARLLEQNVRVFLQARGNVNKGIRNTIESEPGMFFAYNNGVTATAEGVEKRNSGSGLLITRIKNLQIVNGGQTTASIHAASRKNEVNISKVFVQMKLSIISADRSLEVVPRISEYANSQNRVNAADFFANHPFHVRMEAFSRRIFAPSPDGTFRETKWFYERARGQYQDARALLTQAERRKFDLEYPKRQAISKTDLAKFLNVWRGRPDVVSKGAQKNFADFAHAVGREWAKHSDSFSEAYYRASVAKAIIFRVAEQIVTKQPWYEGGYRANVVAYAIAKVAHDVEGMKRAVDFERIWRSQSVSDAFIRALTEVSKSVHGVIVDPPAGMRNVTEWAKQQACWNRVCGLEIAWPAQFLADLISGEEQDEAGRSAIKDQKVLNGIEAQTAVVGAGADLWRSLKEWGESRHLLTPTESSILSVAASIPIRLPSEKQSLRVIQTMRKLHAEGCEVGRDFG